MKIEELLSQFGARHIGQPLTLDANNVCQIDFHSGRRLALEPIEDSDKVWIYGFVGRAPTTNAGVVYRNLMVAHLFGGGTTDCWFAVDPAADEILLNRAFQTAHMEFGQFDALITSFMNQVEHWSRELATSDFEEPNEDAGDQQDSDPFMVRV